MTDRELDPILDELSTWEGDAGPLDPAARHRARTRLLSATENRRRPLWQRPGLRIAVSGLATAAIAATVLVAVRADDGAPATAQKQQVRSVNARVVLAGAAAYDREHGLPVTTPPRDDQFVYTKEIIKETNQKTGETKSYVDENWKSVDGSRRSWVMEIGRGWWSEPLGKNESMWPTQEWDTLKKLPTDPEKLILALQRKAGGGSKSLDRLTTQDWWEVQFSLTGLLKLIPVMPDGLRAASYEALGMVPGVKVVPGERDAKGRTGVAVVCTLDPSGRQVDGHLAFLFDPKTYAFLGFRDVRTSGDGAKKKTYTQLSSLDSWAITDKVKQRP
ncbi:CU044_5270 family protein [Streptomyces sp. NPDC046716]|uniref:CU044_5270 family protein n=1 Tax=Streptomyces sp. NPDC046716 TaxID=3157093 RepID=UPI003401D3E3